MIKRCDPHAPYSHIAYQGENEMVKRIYLSSDYIYVVNFKIEKTNIITPERLN